MTDNENLYQAFERAAPKDDGAILLQQPGGEVFTYLDASLRSARIANALLKSGARPGDRISVQVQKSPDNLFLYLACLRSGLVYHPLNTAYTAEELAFFIDDAGPRIIICDPHQIELFERMPDANTRSILTLDSQGQGSLIDLAADMSDQLPSAARQGSDMAALLYSSGTTGRPKGIMLTHDNLHASAATLVDAWGFTSEDKLLHALPIYHVHGLFVAISCSLLSGSSMSWHNSFDAESVRRDLNNCTVMMGVPTYYTRLLKLAEFSARDCSNMRLFISGSAPLLSDTFYEFEQRSGQRILERYGMTETSMNTSNPLDGERKPGTVGPPLPGVDIRIVDEQGSVVAQGEPGNLQVKGPNVFPGYWQLPEKTHEDFTEDGFFNTGDKASLDRDGYVSIVGRAKDMIISGGLNVYPKEIELVIDTVDGVAESAVIGIPDSNFGEIVVAVVVRQNDDLSADDVIEKCKRQLARFKVPKRLHFVDALPRNAMGKVQKNLLREQYKDNQE